MRDVTQLHPRLQEKFELLQKKCAQKGITIRATECLRTAKEQDALYAKGRTATGPKVTNASGKDAKSMHQWGVAFDVAIDMDADKDGDVDIRDLYNVKLLNIVGRIGQSIGLEWGGSWKSIVDKPHFQLPDWGSTPSRLREEYGTPEKFIETWAKPAKKAKPTKAKTDKAFKRTFETTANLKMRKTPDTSNNSNVILVIKKGHEVIGTGKYITVGTQKWLEVVYGVRNGYCSKKYLK